MRKRKASSRWRRVINKVSNENGVTSDLEFSWENERNLMFRFALGVQSTANFLSAKRGLVEQNGVVCFRSFHQQLRLHSDERHSRGNGLGRHAVWSFLLRHFGEKRHEHLTLGERKRRRRSRTKMMWVCELWRKKWWWDSVYIEAEEWKRFEGKMGSEKNGDSVVDYFTGFYFKIQRGFRFLYLFFFSLQKKIFIKLN